jgi:hypothetical protein
MEYAGSVERGMVIEIGLLQIQPSVLARFLRALSRVRGDRTAAGNVHRHGSVFEMLGKWGLPWPLQFVFEVVEGAAQPVGGEAQGTVRLCDPQESPRHMETAESGSAANVAEPCGPLRAGVPPPARTSRTRI